MAALAPTVFRRVVKEMQSLMQSPPEGIRVLVNEENLADITAWVAGPAGTPYANGYFKVKISLGNDFPNLPPQCWFATKIFHPNVSASGEVCVSTLKKDWTRDLGIGHILLTVKCLLIVPNPESALNEEAGKLLLERYDDYAKHARLMTSIHAAHLPAEVAALCQVPQDENSQVYLSPSVSCSSSASSTSTLVDANRSLAPTKLAETKKKATDKKKKALKRL